MYSLMVEDKEVSQYRSLESALSAANLMGYTCYVVEHNYCIVYRAI
jgi:hypothetical protein